MLLPPWLAEIRDRYENFWIAPEARDRAPARRFERWRRAPSWLFALLPFLLVAAAVAVLLIAIALKR